MVGPRGAARIAVGAAGQGGAAAIAWGGGTQGDTGIVAVLAQCCMRVDWTICERSLCRTVSTNVILSQGSSEELDIQSS
jgi:hypothetical protein